MKILTISTIIPQVRVEATDPIMVKPAIDNLKSSCFKIEAKGLIIVNASFKIIAIREAHHNKIVLNMVIIANPIFREIMRTVIEAKAMAMDLINSEDAVVVGPTIRITMELISITHMTKVLPAVYAADLTIYLSILQGENMT